MHDVRAIEQGMHALWLSLDQASAVAGCIALVIESAADREARVSGAGRCDRPAAGAGARAGRDG